MIGIFGPIGSGKTTVARIIAEQYRFAYLEADALGHQLLNKAEVLKDLIAIFGSSIVTESGNIDRKKLRQVVFTKEAQKNKLESVIWPKMRVEIKKQIQLNTKTVLDAAVLFSAGWDKLCDETIYIGASRKKIIQNCQTKALTVRETDMILKEQQEIIQQAPLADYQIRNEGTIEALWGKVKKVMESIQQRGAKEEHPKE